MKAVSGPLNALLMSQTSFWIVDCIRLTLLEGTYTIRITNAEVGVRLPETSELFYPHAITFSRTAVEQKKGLEVGGFDLDLNVVPELGPLGQSPVIPVSLIQAAMNGIFDSAEIDLYRAFAAGPPEGSDLFLGPELSPSLAQYGRQQFFQPVGSILYYPGFISDVKVSASRLQCSVVSKLSRLDLKYPVNVFTPGCSWTLFSKGCGVDSAAYATPARIVELNDSVLHVVALSGSFDQVDNYFGLGYVKFMTGDNTGFTVSVLESSGGHLKLARQTPFPVAVGDQLIAYPGCDKRWDTCKNKFNNLARWRGFPYMPGPNALIGTPQVDADPGLDVVPIAFTTADVPANKIGGSQFPNDASA